MADQMPQGLYEYLTNVPIISWYPFTEPSHNSGYSPNAAHRDDSSVGSISLNSFSAGQGVVDGELIIPNASSGYARESGSGWFNNGSGTTIAGSVTFILWYKWGGSGTSDSCILRSKGDSSAPGSNCWYEILIDGSTNVIKLRYQFGYSGTYNTVTTTTVFPKDGNYHLLIVRRDAYTSLGTGRYWYVSIDGHPEYPYDYVRTSTEWSPTEAYNNYLDIGGRPSTARGYGSFKGIYIFGGKLSSKDAQHIASFGPPESTWFDYSNWDVVNNTGYVLWKAAEAPSGFKALRRKLLNDIIISWGISNYVDNYVLQRDTDPEFSNPVELYSGYSGTYTDTITTSGHYYYRVKAQITSFGIESPWSESHIYITVTNWEWNFGDGQTLLNDRRPLITYPVGGVYSPSLRVFNDFSSETYTRSDYIEVVDPLHEWNFGDGSPISNEQNPVHIYTAQGVYDVSLRVTTLEESLEVTYPLYVTVEGSSYANFYGTPTRGEKRLTTTFVDTSYGDFTEWLWNFGDGIFSTERNPEHYYRRPGVYTVTLTVRGDAGEFSRVRVNYIIVRSDLTLDIAPEPDKDMYLRGLGFAYKRKVGIEIKRVTGIS